MQLGPVVQDRRGEEAEVRRGAGNVERTRERERLAVVHALRMGEAFQVRVDQLRNPQQDP